MNETPAKIPFFSLVLLIVAAITSIRNFPASALFGSSLIFYLILAACLFLIPITLIAAELSASDPEEGGVYHWVRRAFGEKWAMLAIWLQWINTMIWYPTILSFIGATAAYLIDPALAENKIYLAICIFAIIWLLTLISFFGIRVSARVNDICASIGTVFPMLLLIILGAVWVIRGEALQISLSLSSIIPDHLSGSAVSIVAIMASFLGIELCGVHVKEIANAQKNFPRAVFFASGFILFVMLFGSLAIACVVPQQEIQLVAGVMQVFARFFAAVHLEWCLPVMTILIVIGAIGGIINWLIAPAKGLLQAAEFGYLPRALMKKNRYDVAPRILLAQALFVSLFCCAFLFLPSINGFYWFLMALSTEMYMIMYVLIFLSAIVLRRRAVPQAFRIPGGKLGGWVASGLGLTASIATIVVSFFPPDNVNIGEPMTYALMILGGSAAAILPVFFFFRIKKKSVLELSLFDNK